MYPLAFVQCTVDPGFLEALMGYASVPALGFALYLLKLGNGRYVSRVGIGDNWLAMNVPALIYYFLGLTAGIGGVISLYKQMGF